MNNLQPNQLSIERENLERKYKNTRSNLLVVSIISAVNVLLMLFQSGIYFLFSAYIPLVVVDLGLDFCGKYPTEYYVEVYGDEYVELEFFGTTFLTAMVVIAFLMIVLYLLSWIFSKEHKVGWLVFALVLFSIDTVLMLMLNGIAVEMLLDILFHAWVIFSLVSGIIAHNKLAKLPMTLPDSFPVGDFKNDEATEQQGSQQPVNSTPLRMANLDEKARVFIETDAYGHKIIYRRIKRTNELVIDGYVYDQYEALFEYEHSLYAVIDGQSIEAGYNGKTKTFVKVNGVEIASKIRWH